MNPATENDLLRHELARSRQDLQELVYAVTHDMGAPLRAVTQFSEILANKYVGVLDPQGLTYFSFVRDGGIKAQSMLEGLLAFSRVFTQGEDFTETNLNQVLDRAIENLQKKITQNQAQIKSATLPTLFADTAQLTRLFEILIDNAITYASSARRPEILISSEKVDNGWSLSFLDNGIGISLRNQTAVFQPFKRLHNERDFPGLGMGLAVAKRIVERHHGTIQIVSDGTNGSNFILTLGAV